MDDSTVLTVDLARQSGFLAAHAVWCVSDGGPLVPFIGMELEGGKQNLVRFMDEEDLGRAVAAAQEAFETNSHSALLSTLVYDGYVTLPDGKTDALLLTSAVHCDPPISLGMVLPYRNAEHPDGFAIHRPKFTQLVGIELDSDALGQAFFAGVDSHEEGAAVWTQSMDESK